jgi:hypothetical protein
MGLASGICGGQSGFGARFFPSISVSPAKTIHSTFSIIITITRNYFAISRGLAMS